MKKTYKIIDRNNEEVAAGFKSERKASEAIPVYRDNCNDLALPLRVVPEVTEEEEMKEGFKGEE